MRNNEEINEKVKEIKRSFRLMMDGVASQSMREKGLNYHVNWGASIPMLKQKAAEIGKDYNLSIALWKENVRECKILATMIMPADVILPEVVDIWMEQTPSQEIAEMASFHLYQHLPFAAEKAYIGDRDATALRLSRALPYLRSRSGTQRARHQRVSRPGACRPPRTLVGGAQGSPFSLAKVCRFGSCI